MAFFPFFVDLAGARGLIVGAGSVAYEKAVRIGEFGAKLKVVGLSVDERFCQLPNVEVARRSYTETDIDGNLAFVVAATNDSDLNRRIASRCRELKTPVNVVDSKEDSSFIFPSTIRRGEATIAVSTGGASPTAAVAVKKMIDAIVPGDFGTVVKALGDARERIAAKIRDRKILRRVYRTAVHEAATSESAFDDETLDQVVANALRDDGCAGRVHLVGAGAGSADLITLRGLRILATCDAVLYDDLIDRDILDFAPNDALRLSVGKRAGGVATRQDAINRLMIELASRGMNVVRLKGGDPFLFARAEEEVRTLGRHGIRFDVTPGVSSAFFIPMEAGIPLTCRGVSRSVHIVTAHASDSEVFEELPKFARLDGTLVVMMGLRVVAQLANALIAGGKAPDTPVAVLSGGASAHPYDVRGTLSDLAEKCERLNLKSPAVIVVGKVAELRLKCDRYNDSEKTRG